MPPFPADRGQIFAAIAEDVGVGKSSRRGARLVHHLAANIYRVDLTEITRERTRHAPGAAADFEHAHLLRVLALADVAEVVQDLLFERDHAGAIEFLVVPPVLSGDDIVTRIFSGAPLPIASHSK